MSQVQMQQSSIVASSYSGTSRQQTSAARKTRVFVEKPDVLEEMLESISRPNSASSSPARGRSINFKNQKRNGSPEKDHAMRAREIQQKQVAALTQAAIHKDIETKAKKNDQLFLKHLDVLGQANDDLNVIETNIRLLEENERQKYRRQFDEWNTQVHGTIQVNIAKQVNSMNAKQLNKKKNQDYQKFLDIVNKKPSIFRDIIIESEYDPLEVNRRSIVARTSMLNDPTNIDAIKAKKEGAMLSEESNNGSGGLCKDTLPVELWGTGKIEGTPYGAFAKMMTSSADHGTKENPTQRSHIHFNDFEFPRGKDGFVALNEEMPRGKRIVPQNSFPFRLSQDLAPPDVKSRLKTLQARLDHVINENK